jgi:aspartyl-tRNA(Asn)/glutamyl-tRNA(Gln) amidotransferase subunit C
MNIGPDGVLHVAKLAEIGVDEHELPRLVEQFNHIVDYVAQLDDVPSTAKAVPFLAGPEATPLRDDVVNPAALARPPAAFAPEFADGFFLVPRHGAMEDL